MPKKANQDYLCAMPYITLTADFGTQSSAAAAIRGKIFSALPGMTVNDLCTTVEPFNLQQAVYLFRQAYKHFPSGSFHYVFNDLHADSKQQLLYAYEDRQHIFCPDNGFMTMLFDERPMELFLIHERLPAYDYLHVADAFIAQTGALMSALPPSLQPAHIQELTIRHSATPGGDPHSIEAQVLHIDTFGNVVLNVRQDLFEDKRQGRNFRILFTREGELHKISRHYSDVPEGHNLCLFNTAGYLEIAVNKGNAATLFGFLTRKEKHLFYNNIKIYFE